MRAVLPDARSRDVRRQAPHFSQLHWRRRRGTSASEVCDACRTLDRGWPSGAWPCGRTRVEPAPALWQAQQARLAPAAAARADQQHIHELVEHFLNVPEEQLSPGYAEQKVRELGSRRFRTREAASETLVAHVLAGGGCVAGGQGRSRPEIRRRVKECLPRIREDRTWYRDYDWLRKIMDADPPELSAAFLHFLPFAADDDTETILYLAVYERCKKHPKREPALEPYLADRQPARRALAALVLGKQGTPAQQAAARRLLNDPAPVVRLRAAQGLLAAHDKTLFRP